MDVLWGVGGSKRKRPNDVVGEKIDMFVAPNWFVCLCSIIFNYFQFSIFSFLGMVAPQLEKTDLQGAMQ